MADSKSTGERLLHSIRKAKTGDDSASTPAEPSSAEAPAQPPAAQTRTPTTRKTTARKTAAKKAPVKKAAAMPAASPEASADRSARDATTRAPYPIPATTGPQPSAYPGAAPQDDPFRTPGRVWPD